MNAIRTLLSLNSIPRQSENQRLNRRIHRRRVRRQPCRNCIRIGELSPLQQAPRNQLHLRPARIHAARTRRPSIRRTAAAAAQIARARFVIRVLA